MPATNPAATNPANTTTPTTHLLFDLDGTLTDPQVGILTCIQQALTLTNRPAPTHAELLWCIGPPLHESFAVLAPEASQAEIQELIAHYRERFASHGMFENKVYSQIPELLAALQPHFTLYVCTSKPHYFAKPILEHFKLAHFFTRIYGSELDGTRSDKAQLIAHILTQENLHPQNAIMIGDRKHDILGAEKNGMRSIGVAWGYGSQEELTQAGAGQIASSPESLREILEGPN